MHKLSVKFIFSLSSRHVYCSYGHILHNFIVKLVVIMKNSNNYVQRSVKIPTVQKKHLHINRY
jgi:hypothetical protein